MAYWDHDVTFHFLELYKNHPCIWDPKHKDYKNKKLAYEAWVDIEKKMPTDCSVEELKKKKESLMTAYRKNKTAVQRAEESGVVNEVSWFAFSYMDAFLGPNYTNIDKAKTKNAKDITFNFLELYKGHPCIWDPENKHHKNKRRVYDAWVNIAENMTIVDCSVVELKKKKDSLMTMYRYNKRKQQLAEESGDDYQLTWFAFSYMDSFLGPIYDRTFHEWKYAKSQETNTTEFEADDTRSSIDEADEPAVIYQSTPQHEYAKQSTSKPRKRRYKDPLQLTEVKKERDQNKGHSTDQTFTEEQVLQEIVHIPDDECSTFGTLVAQKLRKLSEDRRDIMMVKINQLFVDERQSNVSN